MSRYQLSLLNMTQKHAHMSAHVQEYEEHESGTVGMGIG